MRGRLPQQRANPQQRKSTPTRGLTGVSVNGNGGSPQSAKISRLKMLVQDLEMHQFELRTQNEELRRSQSEIEEARRKYSDLFDFAPTGYVILNAQGVILKANLTAAALLGMNRRSLIDRGFRRFVKNDDQEKFLAFCQRMTLNDQKIYSLELRLWRKTGESLEARLNAVFTESEDGTPEYQIALSDISDWKQAQREIEKAHKELENRMAERTAVLARLEEQSVQLRQSNTSLQTEVHERKRVEEQAFRQSRQMEGLSRRLIKIQESERHQLALDLHDQLGQVLTGIRLQLQRVRRERQAPGADAPLEESIRMLDGALSQVRQWSFDLRPPLLDDLGLMAALRWYVDERIREFVTPYLKGPRTEKRYPSEFETTFFRITQEALTNVIRHAKAKHVWINFRPNKLAVKLEIRDDGVGFDVDAAQSRASMGGSLGLLGMHERVRLCGGSLKISSARNAGTRVVASIPLTRGGGR